MSCESCSFEDAKGDRERSDQHFGATLVPCRCSAEGRRCCGEMMFALFCAVVAVSRGSGLTLTERVWSLKEGDLKGRERGEKVCRRLMTKQKGRVSEVQRIHYSGIW